MIKIVSLDLWETLIKDDSEKDNERERDNLRAEFIAKTLKLDQSYMQKIHSFFGEVVASFINPEKENEWSLLPETQIDYLINKLGIEVKKEDFDKILKFYTECILDYPPSFTEENIPDILAGLKKKYKLALISNTGRTPGRSLLKLLKNLKIKKYFDFFAFSDELLIRKPDPRIFEIVCSKLNASPEETVHAGDSYKMDFLGAKSAGLNPILYVPGTEKPQGAPYIRTLKEIEEVIEKEYAHRR
jgi:putative hydrolase of the HAD superfamily